MKDIFNKNNKLQKSTHGRNDDQGWFFKRDDVKVLEKAGELTYGLKHDHNKPGKFLNVDALKAILRENAGKHPVILVLIRDHYEDYKDQLPAPIFMDTDNHFIFAVY